MPVRTIRPFSSTYPLSAIESAIEAFCSMRSTVFPERLIFWISSEDLLHHDGGKAERRLVEHNQLGITHQTARDGQHLLLAA